MIVAAVICTILAGALAASLEPLSFALSLPVAVMGGFILAAINRKSK